MSTLVERLHAEAERLSGSSIRNGCPDCGIAANVAGEAAEALSARLIPPAEVVRYEPMVQPFRGEDVVTMAVVNFGQWVRYEDHAAALAAERAARIEADEKWRAAADASVRRQREIERLTIANKNLGSISTEWRLRAEKAERAALTPDAGEDR